MNDTFCLRIFSITMMFLWVRIHISMVFSHTDVIVLLLAASREPGNVWFEADGKWHARNCLRWHLLPMAWPKLGPRSDSVMLIIIARGRFGEWRNCNCALSRWSNHKFFTSIGNFSLVVTLGEPAVLNWLHCLLSAMGLRRLCTFHFR